MLYKAYDIVCSGGLTGRNVKYIHCCLEYDADYANDRLCSCTSFAADVALVSVGLL